MKSKSTVKEETHCQNSRQTQHILPDCRVWEVHTQDFFPETQFAFFDFGASEGWVFFVNFINKLPKMVLLQRHGTAVAGSSQSGMGKMFSVHCKESRLA